MGLVELIASGTRYQQAVYNQNAQAQAAAASIPFISGYVDTIAVNGDIVPREAFWSTDKVNNNVGLMIPSAELKAKLTSSTDYSSLSPEEINMISKGVQDILGPEAYLQTAKYHHYGWTPSESIISMYSEYNNFDWTNSGVINHAGNKKEAWEKLPNRPIYTDSGGLSALGSGGGESYMQADFRSSPFQLPDIDIQRFRLEPVLRAGFLPARRPGRFDGIREHPSRYNTMRVMGIGGDAVFASTDFMLPGLQEESSENFSVNPSMWGLSIRFDIEKYSIYTLTMELINSHNFDWLRQFKYAWKNYLRGSVLAGNQWRFYMLSGARLLGGYPVKYQMLSAAKDEPATQMSMVMIVTDDEALPKMQEIVDKRSGLTFFKWEGSVYSSPIAGVKNPVIGPVEKSQDLLASSEDETTFPPEMTVI